MTLVTVLVAVVLERSVVVRLARSAPNSLQQPGAPPWFNQVREPGTAPPGRDGPRRVRPWGRCTHGRPGPGVVPPDATPVVESSPVRRHPLPPDPCPVRRSSPAAPTRAREQGDAHLSRDRRSDGLNPRLLDPQQRQAIRRTWAIMYLSCLRCWWALVCHGRRRRQLARSSPRFSPHPRCYMACCYHSPSSSDRCRRNARASFFGSTCAAISRTPRTSPGSGQHSKKPQPS